MENNLHSIFADYGLKVLHGEDSDLAEQNRVSVNIDIII